MAAPKINLPTTGRSKNSGANTSVCENRDSYEHSPRDITFSIYSYLPFQQTFASYKERKNLFGWTIYRRNLESGMVFPSFDGRRVVFEVGCKTIIYLLIHPNRQHASHHRFFIQSINGFVYDITEKLMAAEVVRKTTPMVTLVKYEMYFFMGMFSALSLPMWLAVTGSDLLYTASAAKAKHTAARQLAKVILFESNDIKVYAPTLHRKLELFLEFEKKVKWSKLGKQLPETIIKDDKTQGMVAGILFGKATIAHGAFNAWTVLYTILMQAATKPFTKAIDAYADVISNRYGPIINNLSTLNYNDSNAVKQAAQQLAKIMQESGVEITAAEAEKIIGEIRSNPEKLYLSLQNIQKSLAEFAWKMKS